MQLRAERGMTDVSVSVQLQPAMEQGSSKVSGEAFAGDKFTG